MRSTHRIGGNFTTVTWLVSTMLWMNMILMTAIIPLCSPTTVTRAMRSVPMIRKSGHITGKGVFKGVVVSGQQRVPLTNVEVAHKF